MTIKLKAFDIRNVRKGMIVHGCNAQGVMGSGLAKTIRYTFPEAYRDYRVKYADEGLNVGDCIISQINSKLFVSNCITQEFYGYDGQVYASKAGILVSVTKAFIAAQELGCTSIYMNRIGCIRGGLSWDEEVEPIISRIWLEYPSIRLFVSK